MVRVPASRQPIPGLGSFVPSQNQSTQVTRRKRKKLLIGKLGNWETWVTQARRKGSHDDVASAVLHDNQLAGPRGAQRDAAEAGSREGRHEREDRDAEAGDQAAPERGALPGPDHDHHTVRAACAEPHDQEAAAHLLGDCAEDVGGREAAAGDDPGVRCVQEGPAAPQRVPARN